MHGGFLRITTAWEQGHRAVADAPSFDLGANGGDLASTFETQWSAARPAAADRSPGAASDRRD